jgi:hypothetical protein
MAQSQKAKISKQDAIRALADFRVVDFTEAKKEADIVAKLSGALRCNDNTLSGVASVLLTVGFLIDQQTECGTQDLDCSVAHGIGFLIDRCAHDIQNLLAVAGRED